MGNKMKYFVSGDIHSAYTAWMKALNEAGFDESNKEHKIILLGDLLDRMDESTECVEFVKDMLKKDKLIYILGNHESPLMTDLWERGYYERHDQSNGTVKTILNLAGIKGKEVSWWGIRDFSPEDWNSALTKAREILEPLYEQAVDYYESKHYIFTHGFIPTKIELDEENYVQGMPLYYQKTKMVYDPDWRKADNWQWQYARWTDGPEALDQGLNQTGKTLVVGHIHASRIRAKKTIQKAMETLEEWEDMDELQWGEKADFSPYYFEDGRGICCDSCVAHTKYINVVVIEDEELEDE